MKLQISFIFFLLANLFALNSMESISEDHFEAEDADMAQWFKQVNDFIHKNQNNSQQIDKFYEKTQEINEKLSEQQQKQMGLEGKVSALLEEIYDLKQKLQENEKNSNRNIVIQRRQDGSVDFYRNWDEYKNGFGNETGEFFIGLEKLYKLTNSRPYELLIVMEDWENDRRYAKYDQFVVASEEENYLLKSLGAYSGTAGDSLSNHVSHNFSTKDRDQDASTASHCATVFKGGWWFKSCLFSNLNGEYFKNSKPSANARGVNWYQFRGDSYSLKFVEMILMPTCGL